MKQSTWPTGWRCFDIEWLDFIWYTLYFWWSKTQSCEQNGQKISEGKAFSWNCMFNEIVFDSKILQYRFCGWRGRYWTALLFTGVLRQRISVQTQGFYFKHKLYEVISWDSELVPELNFSVPLNRFFHCFPWVSTAPSMQEYFCKIDTACSHWSWQFSHAASSVMWSPVPT